MKATQHWLCECGSVIEPGEEFEIHQGDFLCPACIQMDKQINQVTENTLILN